MAIIKNKKISQILTVVGFIVLAIFIPISTYFIARTVFDIRERAEEAETFTVCTSAGDGCDFVGGDGIQQAVDAAQDGDTVLIGKGTYTRSEGTVFTTIAPDWTEERRCFVAVDEGLIQNQHSITIRGAGAILDGENSAPMEGICTKRGYAKIYNLVIKGFKSQAETDSLPKSFGTGIYADGAMSTTITNCVLIGNGRGVHGTYHNQTKIINSIIVDSTSSTVDPAHACGILATEYNNMQVFYSIVHNNHGGNFCSESYYNIGTHFGVLEIDPLLDANYKPQASSPAIDGGDPAIKDPDGSTSDIGVYGGLYTCDWDPDECLGPPPDCPPNCEGKECGDDGCGDSCGTCSDGQVCNDSYACVDEDDCVPDCDGKECGDDGCGEVCDYCPWGETCNVDTCETDDQCDLTTITSCSEDGDCEKITAEECCTCLQGGSEFSLNSTHKDLYEDCKNCAESPRCLQSDTCTDKIAYCGGGTCFLKDEDCVLDCEGKDCGDDGCGGTCGTCPDGEICDDSDTCVEEECTPDCEGKDCGDDGCEESCGTCPSGETCNDSGVCIEGECTPDCEGKDCGDDGCGSSCGTCISGMTCNHLGICTFSCTPSCTGKECGSNGCGGTCGICPSGESCNLSGVCVISSSIGDDETDPIGTPGGSSGSSSSYTSSTSETSTSSTGSDQYSSDSSQGTSGLSELPETGILDYAIGLVVGIFFLVTGLILYFFLPEDKRKRVLIKTPQVPISH